MKPFIPCSLIYVLFALLCSQLAFAGLPTITGLRGEAKVLTKTGENLPSLLYEGEKYFYSKAKIGTRVSEGALLLCGNDCRVKLVYPSGTSLYVAPGTTFQIVNGEQNVEKKPSILSLLYGRVRTMVAKPTGGQNKWEVRTPTAVNGVRGTDFVARYNPMQGTEVNVLSGRVEVQPIDSAKTKIELGPAQSVVENAGENASGQLQAVASTKAQILAAFEISSVPIEASQTQIQELEKQSKAVMLQELKSTQPEVFKKIADPESLSTPQLHRRLINKPLRQAKRSVSAQNLESFTHDLENYKKYRGAK